MDQWSRYSWGKGHDSRNGQLCDGCSVIADIVVNGVAYFVYPRRTGDNLFDFAIPEKTEAKMSVSVSSLRHPSPRPSTLASALSLSRAQEKGRPAVTSAAHRLVYPGALVKYADWSIKTVLSMAGVRSLPHR